MNRRAFLSAFSTAAAAIAFDPEKALWTPGKLISIPRPLPLATPAFFNLGDMITFEGLYASPGVLQKFIVTAAGKSFDDIRFRFFDPSCAALIRPLQLGDVNAERIR